MFYTKNNKPYKIKLKLVSQVKTNDFFDGGTYNSYN